ncbi:hypothetical protein E6P09_11750 [Haloferax mediterranei ATCC 33500]|uniref:Uncharacterized protein n=1 Tax=Haloferax mediterranei (strain ATCC 33500 / DSM 1411 / JCM 8866 / NBRC 14739 / NCIMB 2177 / R-4) TaxID=523841 RepID=I3R5E0_HALMT|nr:DUF5804 family protein [Haloferax mediterranei]AFK19450.1 hypothetical protein HFX_1743 [Haloferax mediterranei ATCC 33500]AHZ21203.1 hypothetical protein BM92_00395 [Haloferax mediterranei ATCC 33500]EMA04363.1 hypothetical protein C439_01772 [Haloferax mediterranei ATCC 33500]MDX5989552.1 DUF5804 family protein [Haloferax mediterranei ATCC 33500]QCQ75910.1 hypothetical protein E6P09_11750 [Haloferax mediterranei ATCC 33500]
MTQVCIVGAEDVHLQYELLSRDTARAALSTYDISEPFENSLSIETVSLGAAVSLLNDLNWYLVRFAAFSLILEPSVSTDEWLSRDLARKVRDGQVQPEATGDHLAIYGVEDQRLVEPMYVTRVDGSVPEYDLRDVDETVVVRVGEDEFGR